MKAGRFSDAQKAFILKQAEEGVPIGDVCRKAGISQATFYSWRKKYAGLLPTEMRRLKALEDENARLKKLVAELSLDREMLQGTLSGESSEACPAAATGGGGSGELRRVAAPGVRDARCQSLHLPVPFPPARTGPSGGPHQEICETRVRYGYRRVHVHLRREGWNVNHKKVHRIYNELRLQLRNKTPKRRVKAKLREDRCAAVAANETWAMDFVHDQLATGRKLRVLTIVDTWSRFSPAVDPRFSYRAGDVVATLDRVCAEVGFPKTIRVDQGSDFI